MSGLRLGSAQTHTVAGCQGRFVETDAVGTWVPLAFGRIPFEFYDQW